MQKLINILEEIKPGVDFNICKTLVDDGVIDSFDIISMISELNDEFDISITAVDIVPENFNSAESLYAMVQRLMEEF